MLLDFHKTLSSKLGRQAAKEGGVGVAAPPLSRDADLEGNKEGANINDRDIAVSDQNGTPKEQGPEGVQKIEAVAQVWNTQSLIIAYAGIFLVFFINSLQQQTTGNLTPYVTSSFALHELVSTISVVSSIIGGVLKLPIAQLINLWGRAEGYACMICLCVLGLILMAACDNVQTYAAAQCFYWVGYNGMAYVLDVFIADTSALKNRGLMLAFSTTPYIATTFAGPVLAQSFYEGPGWRWGNGVWALILPAVSAPFMIILTINQRKAEKKGLILHKKSDRSLLQSCVHYFWELDVIGLVLLCAGFVLILLPVSLAKGSVDGWRSDGMIAMFVIGGCCLIFFAIYERYIAKVTFIPYSLLLDRTVFGACMLSMTMFISFYCWDSYFTSYLQVVHQLSIKDAGYVYNIYSIGSCFFSVIVGLLIRYSGRFKWLGVFVGLPLYLLGTGLMIHFRSPSAGAINYVIMSQIFVAFGGGTLVICEQIAVMAPSAHQNVAAVLAFLGLFSSVGGGIGGAISGGIWTNTMPAQLQRLLPDELKNQTMTIYSSLTVQLEYEWGSPARIAIVEAYGYTQKLLTIAATAVLCLAVIWVFMWRDIKVGEIRNGRGRVA